MGYEENIRAWRALSPERKLRLRWDAIPLHVASSMAFAGEPVPIETIREFLARIPFPAMLEGDGKPDA